MPLMDLSFSVTEAASFESAIIQVWIIFKAQLDRGVLLTSLPSISLFKVFRTLRRIC